MIKFRYNGEAVGKGRPRVRVVGGFPQLYTPEKTREYEAALRFEFMSQNCEAMPVYDKDVPLVARLTFGFAVPKSYSKKKRKACLEGDAMHTHKPDTDNLIKSTLDALNGVAFSDDAAIVLVVAEKVYAEEPFVEVEINEL